LNILVFSWLSDHKLWSKLEPIAALDQVEEIYLVRRKPLLRPKVVNVCPPEIICEYLWLAEPWRFMAGFRILVTRKVDFVMGIYFMYHGMMAALLGKLFRKPYILNVIGNDIHEVFKNRLNSGLTMGAYAIITRGLNTKGMVESNGFPGNRIFCPANVFKVPEIPDPLLEIQPSFDIVYVGALARYKRLDILLEIISELKHAYGLRDIRLSIVGQGPLMQELKNMSEALVLQDNVVFYGHHPDIYPFLRDAKILVMTSESEGLPMVIVEAMACGLPCIATDDADIGTMITNNENGFVLPFGDIGSFAERIVYLLDAKNKPVYEKMSQRAKEMIKQNMEKYDIDYIRKEWYNILFKL
jgi:glycosyltransferase involved in cell wall biosynthesis